MSVRVAVVHEWLTARAGSELCFERIAGIWPDADLYALSWDPSVEFDVGGRDIRTTVIDRPTRSPRGRAALLPVMWAAFRSMQVPEYDLVVTSSHAFSRAFPVGSAVHVSYTYTPMRYVWFPEIDTRGAGAVMAPARHAMQKLDLRFAQGVHEFAAISSFVADRIAQVYDREAEVIFPICDTEFFMPGADEHDTTVTTMCDEPFLLSVGRFVPYKRHDLAIELGARLGITAVIAGSGPELTRLRRLAERHSGARVVFVEAPSRELIRALYRRAAFTLFPALEDFGIVPVESLASGTPVLALDAGGARDTVPREVGERSASTELEELVESAERLLGREITAEVCREWSRNFSPAVFDRRIREWTEAAIERGQSTAPSSEDRTWGVSNER